MKTLKFYNKQLNKSKSKVLILIFGSELQLLQCGMLFA